MNTKEVRVFETPDVYLIAAIVFFLKIDPQYKIFNGKTFGCFTVSDDLYRVMSAYNAGAEVPAIQYAEIIKRIRAELITRRTQRS